MVFDMHKLQKLSVLALKLNSKIVSAESCTAGLLSASLTEIPGSSAFFEQGYITYSNNSKTSVLGVENKTLKKYGAVSEQVAKQMAKGALKRSNSTIAISITGIAGPGGSDYKPEGLVCFAVTKKNGKTRTETMEYGPLGRSKVRSSAVKTAINLLFEEMSVV
jgi:nicotinamide-nucleotide amidase|tara:strand:+ start:1420 stop:1908 length:489 start_codon:yes stop_codon:yes gene_type:complete